MCHNLSLNCHHKPWLLLLLLAAAAARGQTTNTPTYTFDDGLVPADTTLWKTADSSGNQVNAGEGVTNAGGFQNSGMLILTVPGAANVQSFAQWLLPDFAVGSPITNLACSFNVFLGGPNPGGNGMLFHWGPGLKNQYSGSASSFGQGLDVTLRTYGSGVNSSGINVYYAGTNTPGNNPPVAANAFLGYYRGGVTNFASNTWVSFSVTVVMTGSQTNALLSLVCSNAWNGLTNIYSNLLLTNFTAPLTNHTMAFAATDGGGVHEFCYLDNVDFRVNGSHVGGSTASNAVVLTLQPASQTVAEGLSATFSSAVTGTPPLTYQWFSNGVTIAGANTAYYTTPPTTCALSGTLFAVTVSNSFSGAVSSNAVLTVTPPPPSRTAAWTGVNLAGADFDAANLPGTYGVDYIYPNQAEVTYFQSNGMNIIRLPFLWERLQHTNGTALDPTELGRLNTFVSQTTAKGLWVILDPHNYARYYNNIIGSTNVSVADFANFWGQVAAIYRTNTLVIFGLMNEPHDMPTATWLDAANAAMSAIRGAGAANLILVPGNAWTGAWSWCGNDNATVMLGVFDPANNFAFEAHQYLDTNSSGTSATCVNATIGSQRLACFTMWCRTNGYRAFLGEFAGGNNGVCDSALSDMLSFVDANNDVWLGWTYWAGGPWWSSTYIFNIEPSGSDNAVMSVLGQYFALPQPLLTVANGAAFQFQAPAGFIYQMQASASLLPGSWSNYGAPITGAAQQVTVPMQSGAQPQEFYRARVTHVP